MSLASKFNHNKRFSGISTYLRNFLKKDEMKKSKNETYLESGLRCLTPKMVPELSAIVKTINTFLVKKRDRNETFIFSYVTCSERKLCMSQVMYVIPKKRS